MLNKCNYLFTLFISSAIILISGCSSSTDSGSVDLTPPPIPSGLEIIKLDNGAATLSWDKVSDSGLRGYHVYWLGGAPVDTLNANMQFIAVATVTIAGLDYSTNYSFAVTSIDKSGNESGLSIPVDGKPLNTTRPSPPTGIDLVAENINYPKITVYWLENDEPDMAVYNVYKALSIAGLTDSASSFVTSLTAETFVDADVEISTVYYYRISAIDKGALESMASTTVSDVVLPKVPLITPVGFEYTSSVPKFKWDGVQGSVKYNLVLSTSHLGGEIWNIEIDGSTTEITYSGNKKLISGNTYYWRIGAISRKEINSISETGSFVVRLQ